MDARWIKVRKQADKAIISIVLLFIILIFTGCNNTALIMYTPTPQPETTPPAAPQEKSEASDNITSSTNYTITENREYNYNYPIPDVIGNTGANINSGGLCVYDDSRVYYIDMGIYSMTNDGIDIIQILDMQNISCLNSAGDYLYFISNHDGGIYRVRKEENAEPEFLLITGASSLIIIDESMYYTCGMCDTSSNLVYKTQVGGTNQECLFFKANNLYPDNSYIYFDNLDDDGKLYRYDTISNEIVKLSDDKAAQINVVDNQIYYISEDKSFNVVRMDRNGENTIVVVSESCNNLNVKGETLIYTPAKTDNIKSYNIKSGETNTLLKHKGTDGLCIAGSIIFFETIVVKGQEPTLYYLNLKNNELNKELPVNIYGYISNIDINNKSLEIDVAKVYTDQEAIEMYAKNNDITIEQAKEELYNEQGIYYIYNTNREPREYDYLEWTRVMQKRKPTSLNISTPYVSDVLNIASMYMNNPSLQDKLVYSFVILNGEILDIEELFYPVDFYE